ncbi:MAG: hypothetical protein IT385_07040 [Deltaproteobacteria bacterium]|nr:hypothetical protein [Deltaproteobacteria bacterium]
MVATASQRTPTAAPSSQTDAPAGERQAQEDPKATLRQMDYGQQVQALTPAGGATPPPASQAPAKPAPAPAPAKKPEKTRSQILRDQAKAMESIESMMTTGFTDWAITDAEAKKSMDLLGNIRSTAELAVVVQTMNQRGSFMKDLIDNVPEGARSSWPLTWITLISLTNRTQLIAKAVDNHPGVSGIGQRQAEDPAVGWLMTKVPSDTIKRYGRRMVGNAAGAPWFERWIELTPKGTREPIEQSYKIAQGEGKQKQAADDAKKAEDKQLGERFDKDAKMQKTVKTVEDLLSYAFTDWCITDAEARQAFAIFKQMPDADSVKYLVRKLDKAGPFMDRFIDNLPSAERWGEKKAFLRICAARDPMKNVPFVKELLSYGVFDWAITDEEARLAFYLVKTMPPDVRDQFKRADDGKWWARMEGNVDQETRTEKDANFYNNKEEIQKAKLELQANAAKWTPGALRMHVEMMIRMGEEDFVETTIQGLGLADKPECEFLFKEMGFARPGGKRDDKVWKTWKERSAGQKFVDGMKTAATVAKYIGKAAGSGLEYLFTDKTSMSADLGEIQDIMGGDIEGVKIGKADKERTNQLDLGVDMNVGLITVRSAGVNIASVARMMDTTRLQTGPIAVDGIEIIAKWPTEKDPSHHYKLAIKGVSAKDIWHIGEQSMTGVGAVTLKDFVFEGKQPAGDKPKDKGALMGQALADIQDAVTRLLGMVKDPEPQPEQLGMRIGHNFTGAMDVKVSMGALNVQNVTQSSGGKVGEVNVKGLDVSQTHGRKVDVIRGKLKELEEAGKKQPLTDEQKAQKVTLEAQLPKLAVLEKREAELLAQRKASETGKLPPAEQEELAHLRDQLMVSQAEVGIKALEVKDLDMAGVKAESLSIADLKGKAVGERDGVAGEAKVTGGDTVDPKQKNNVKMTVEVGAVSGKNLVMQGANKLEAYEKKLKEFEDKLDKKEKLTDEQLALRDELKGDVDKVHRWIVRRDELKLMPKLDDKQKGELETLSKDLEPWVGRKPDTKVATIEAKGKDGQPALKAELDSATGKRSVKMADATVTGVESGDLKVKSANVTGLEASVTAGGGLTDFDFKKTMTSAEAKVGSARLDQVEMGGEALSVKYQRELDELALKATMDKEHKAEERKMTKDEVQRLAELPARVDGARKDEAELARLRAEQKQGALEPEDEQKLKLLADRVDPKKVKVKSIEANDVALSLDTKSGKVEVGVGKDEKGAKPGLKVEGVEMGQVRPDGSLDVQTSVDTATIQSVKGKLQTEGGIDKILDVKQNGQLAGEVEAKGVDVQGVAMKAAGKESSSAIQAELDALTEKSKKDPKALSPEQMKRLKDLPALLKQAMADERRLDELRRIQKTSPKDFKPDMEWEMKALAKRLDPTYTKVAKVEVAEVKAKADTKSGKVEVGIQGKDGKPGVRVEGVEMGTIGPDGKPVADTKVGVAKLDSLSADAQLDGNAAALFDPTKSDTLKANVKAKGIAVENFEQGQAGEPGHKKLDKGTIDEVEASYDKADGGKASVALTGAKLEGFEMKSTKLADTQARMGELLAKLRGGQDMKPDEMKELQKLDAELEEYKELKRKYAEAKTKQWKKYYEDKLAVWEKESVTAVKKANVTKLEVNAQNVGDITKGSPDLGKVKLDAKLDHADAEGVQAGDLKIGKASVDGLAVSAENLKDPEKRKISGSMKSAELESLKTGSAMASKIKVKDAKGGMDGRSVDVRAGRVSAYNAYSGGGGVGEAHLGGFGVGIRNFGTDKETTSVVSASLNASAISKARKGGLTTIDSAQGRGFRMQSGKGGPKGVGGSIGFDQVDAQNIQDHSVDEKGNRTSISLGDAGGKGVDIRSKYGVTTIKAGEGYASNFNMSGEDKEKGSSMGAHADRVDAMGATVRIGTPKDKNGSAPISAEVDEASVQNGSFNARSKTGPEGGSLGREGEVSETNAHVGSVRAKGVTFAMNDKKMQAGFAEGDVQGAQFEQRTLDKDDKEKSKVEAGVGKGKVERFSMTKEGDDNLDVSAGRIKGEDLRYTKTVDGKVVQTLDDIASQGGEGSQGKTNSVEVKDLSVKKRGEEVAIEYGEIRGDNLVFKDESDPESKTKAVLSYFQAGASGERSKVKIGADGKIDADLKTIKIGGGSTFKFGKDPKQMVTLQEELKAGRITLSDFNPKDPTEAGSQLQILDVDGAKILYSDSTRTAFVEGAKIDKIYASGLGNGQLAAGYEGAEVKSLEVYEQSKDEAGSEGHQHKMADLKGVNSSRGDVLLERKDPKDPSSGMDLKYAEIADVDIKKLGLDIDLRQDPNLSADQIEEKKKQAAEAKAKEEEEKAKDPEKYRWDLGALDKTSGKVKLKIPAGILRKAAKADEPTEGGEKSRWQKVKDGAKKAYNHASDKAGEYVDHEKIEVEVDIVDGKLDGGMLEEQLKKYGADPSSILKIRQYAEDKLNKPDDGKPSDPLLDELEFKVDADVGGGHVKAGQYASLDLKEGGTVTVETKGKGMGDGVEIHGEDIGAKNVTHGEASDEEKGKLRQAGGKVRGPYMDETQKLEGPQSMSDHQAENEERIKKEEAEELRKKRLEEEARKKKWEEERQKAQGGKAKTAA